MTAPYLNPFRPTNPFRSVAAPVAVPKTYSDSLDAVTGKPLAVVHPSEALWKADRAIRRLPNEDGFYSPILDVMALSPEADDRTRAHEAGHRLDSYFYGDAKLQQQFDSASAVNPRPAADTYAATNRGEHFAEAFDNAIQFLRQTSKATDQGRVAGLLNIYEGWVPGTEVMVKHLLDQPLYGAHPLQQMRGDGVPAASSPTTQPSVNPFRDQTAAAMFAGAQDLTPAPTEPFVPSPLAARAEEIGLTDPVGIGKQLLASGIRQGGMVVGGALGGAEMMAGTPLDVARADMHRLADPIMGFADGTFGEPESPLERVANFVGPAPLIGGAANLLERGAAKVLPEAAESAMPRVAESLDRLRGLEETGAQSALIRQRIRTMAPPDLPAVTPEPVAPSLPESTGPLTIKQARAAKIASNRADKYGKMPTDDLLALHATTIDRISNSKGGGSGWARYDDDIGMTRAGGSNRDVRLEDDKRILDAAEAELQRRGVSVDQIVQSYDNFVTGRGERQGMELEDVGAGSKAGDFNPAELGRARTPVLSGLAGAGVGGVAGAKTDTDNPFRGALIGAAGGALLGAGAGKLVEKLPGLNERGGVTVPPINQRAVDEAISELTHPRTRKPFAGEVNPEDFVNKAKFALDPSGEQRFLGEVERVVRSGNIAPKQVITWDQTREIARSMGLDKIDGKVGRLDGPRMLAIRNIVSQNVDALEGLYQKMNAGGLDKGALGELDGQIAVLEKQNDALLSRFVKARTQTGRDLNNLKILANRVMDPVTWLSKAENLMQQGGRTLSPEQRQIITGLVNAGDKGKLVQYIAQLRPSGAGEKITSLWKAGLLTSPTTHAANILGNTAMAGLEVAKDIPATIVDRILGIATGQKTKAFSVAREARASWKGAVQGVKEAKLALQGVPLDDALAKWDLPKTTDQGNPVLNAYTHGVFRSLEAEDRIFRSIALQRSLSEQLALNGGKLTDEIALQAVRDAEYATFQNEGVLAKAAKGLKRPLGAVGEAILPFARTPANVATRVVEYSPLGALKTGRGVYQLVRGMHAGLSTQELRSLQRVASESAGRSITGSAPIAAGYLLAKYGKMTGARPASSSERETWNLEGKQENAVLIGGKWRSVQRISPVGNLMALGANLYTLSHNPELSTGQVAAAGVGSIGTTVSEQSFLSGVQDLTDALKDPVGSAGKYAGNLASSVVPAIVGRVARAVDPKVREVKTIQDAFKNRIPGLSKELPAKIDQFGREAQRQGGAAAILDPFNSRTDQRTDPVIKEVERIGAAIGPLRQRAEETPQQYQERKRQDGRRLYERLRQIVNHPRYKAWPDSAKKDLLEGEIAKARSRYTRARKRAA